MYTHPPIFRTHYWFCCLVLTECRFGILLTWTSKEGLPLFAKEMDEYFPLSFFGGGHCWQERKGLFASGYLVLAKYLGIYGLNDTLENRADACYSHCTKSSQ